jgi:hypothetical protein
MVTLLKEHTNMDKGDEYVHFRPQHHQSNVAKEMEYFQVKLNKSYERT